MQQCSLWKIATIILQGPLSHVSMTRLSHFNSVLVFTKHLTITIKMCICKKPSLNMIYRSSSIVFYECSEIIMRFLMQWPAVVGAEKRLMSRLRRGTVDATSPWASHCVQDPTPPGSHLDLLFSSPVGVASPGTQAERGGGACLCLHLLWTRRQNKRKSPWVSSL